MPIRPIRAAKFNIKKKNSSRKSYSKTHKTPNQKAGAIYSFDLNDRVGGLAAVKSLYKTSDSDCPMGGVNDPALGYDYYDPTKTHSGGRRGKRSLRKSQRNRKSKHSKTQKRQQKYKKNNRDNKQKTQRKSLRGGGWLGEKFRHAKHAIGSTFTPKSKSKVAGAGPLTKVRGLSTLKGTANYTTIIRGQRPIISRPRTNIPINSPPINSPIPPSPPSPPTTPIKFTNAMMY